MTNPEDLPVVAKGAPDVPFPVHPLSDLVYYLQYRQSAERAVDRLKQFIEVAKFNTDRLLADFQKRAQFFKDRLHPYAVQELAQQAGAGKTVKTPLGGKLAFRAQKPKLVVAEDKEFIETAEECGLIDRLCKLGVLNVKYTLSKTGLRDAIKRGELPSECADLAAIEEEAPPDSFSISFDDEAGFLELAGASDIRSDDSHLVYVNGLAAPTEQKVIAG